jgi:effector-binding domain-containing protein
MPHVRLVILFALALALGFPAGPSAAQTTVPSPAKPGDPFGQEVTMTEKTIIYFSGTSSWDNAFPAILDGLKSVYGVLKKQEIPPAGPPMTIYTSTDDAGFQFQAAVPIAAPPANPPQGDIALGKSPAGKALKFIHRGSYQAMDLTYEAISNHLDDKGLDAKDLFVEEYINDPITTPEEKLVIEIYVPIR